MHDITQLWGMCIIGKEEEEEEGIINDSKWMQSLQLFIDDRQISDWLAIVNIH